MIARSFKLGFCEGVRVNETVIGLSVPYGSFVTVISSFLPRSPQPVKVKGLEDEPREATFSHHVVLLPSAQCWIHGESAGHEIASPVKASVTRSRFHPGFSPFRPLCFFPLTRSASTYTREDPFPVFCPGIEIRHFISGSFQRRMARHFFPHNVYTIKTLIQAPE